MGKIIILEVAGSTIGDSLVFVPVSPVGYGLPPFAFPVILLPYVFVLACAGVALGFVLERVRHRSVSLGFIVYLVLAFMLGFIFMSGAALWSMFLVLFAYVTHAVRRGVGKPGETAVRVSLDLRNKLGLMVAVALVLVGFVSWIMLGLDAFGSFGVLLQGCAVALVVWVLFAGGEKSVGLVRFVVRVFVVSFVLTFFLWFVDAWFSVSWVLSWVLLFFGRTFVFSVLPLSLLPVAIGVTAYGVFRRRLHALLILFSSWYVFIFVVFAAYDVWWTVFIYPYLTGPPYFGGGGLIARDILLVFTAFVAALIFTGIYVWFRKLKQSPPP